MFILAFNLNWFTTIPGILITLGIVLLIVAIILFIAGNKKSKPKVDEYDQSALYQNNMNNMGHDTVTITPMTVEVKNEPPVSMFSEVNIGTPGVDPINPVDNNVVSTNSVESNFNVAFQEVPTVNPVEAEPITNNTLDQTMVSVYGEDSQDKEVSTETVAIPQIQEEPVKPTIYGGNDPLEATQNIPKVEEHHEPYNGAFNEVKLVEPNDEESIQIPVVNFNTNVEQPVEVAIPQIQEEPVPVEISTEPVEIPIEPVTIPVENVEVSSDPVEVTPAPVEIPTAPVEIPVAPIEIPTVMNDAGNDNGNTNTSEQVPVVDSVEKVRPSVEEL